MQLCGCYRVLAIFTMPGTLADASAEDLYSLILSIMLLSLLQIDDQLPRGGAALALRLQPINSSATGTKTDQTVYAF